MLNTEWLFILVFLGLGALTFLRLLASARRAVVSQAEAEVLARKAEEEARREDEAEQEVHVAKGVG